MPKSPEVLRDAFLRAPDQALLDCKTIAAWLGYSPRWLALRIESGDDVPPNIRYPGSRKLLFRKADVVQWISDQTTKSIQKAENAEKVSREFEDLARRLSNYLFSNHGDRCGSLASHKNKNEGGNKNHGA